MNTPSILKKIVAKKKIRLIEEKITISLSEMIELSSKAESKPSFSQTLKKDGLSIIGEIKKASPSKGLIRQDFNPVALAKEYENCVDALSVLTEEDFFLGSPSYLAEVAASVNLPILRKDFIIDAYQIYQAKALGASAILLILAILSPSELEEYIKLANGLGLEALVETHSVEEAKIALEAGANIIGINNRDLNTFDVDLDTTLDIAKIIPQGKILISESGFHTGEDIAHIKDAQIDGILVGESFMKCGDINAKAKEFKNAYAN